MNSEHDESAEDEEIPLGFLSPSKKPDALGRLGHYEVLEVIGKGAFGTVLRAFDEKLHRMVAIKIMSAELASTSPARKRFLREARSAAAIRHDNVVAIHAVEEEPIPYLVMEYIPGKTLQQFLDAHGPLDVTDTLRLSQQMASGLALGCPTLGDLTANNLAELKQIKRLSLAGSGLGDDGIKHLASLTNLESLDLRRTKATAAGIAELQLALPTCQIASDFPNVAGEDAGK